MNPHFGKWHIDTKREGFKKSKNSVHRTTDYECVTVQCHFSDSHLDKIADEDEDRMKFLDLILSDKNLEKNYNDTEKYRLRHFMKKYKIG